MFICPLLPDLRVLIVRCIESARHKSIAVHRAQWAKWEFRTIADVAEKSGGLAQIPQ
jgi:hypothetical protein